MTPTPSATSSTRVDDDDEPGRSRARRRMTGPGPRLSLVVPAFNEERRIEASLQRIGEFLASQSYERSCAGRRRQRPGRPRRVQRALDALPPAGRDDVAAPRDEPRQRRRRAHRRLAATGRYVAFIDADLATPPEELLPMVAALEAGADVAIGVRTQRDGSDMRDRRRLLRRLAGRPSPWPCACCSCPTSATASARSRLFAATRRSASSACSHRHLVLRRRAALPARTPGPDGREDAGALAGRAGLPPAPQPEDARELLNLLRIRWTHRRVGPQTGL